MLISVIVPVYNDEKYIKNCLESIANQTFKDIEIIVVDDGSTDNSGIICDEFSINDPRFKVIHKQNKGVCDSRNKGLEIASGEYICFVDSDDWIENDYFETMKAILISKKYSIIFNPLIQEKINGKIAVNSLLTDKELLGEESIYYLFCENLFSWGVVSTFFKRNTLEQIRFNLESVFGEDFEFKYKAIKQATGVLYFSSITKYHYVYRQDSSIVSYSIIKKANDLEIIKKIMSQETSHFKEILFWKQYIPRILAYALIGCNSNDKDEFLKGRELRNEVLIYKWKVLFYAKSSFVSKIKMLILLMPSFLERIVANIYINLKSNRL